MPVLDAQKLTKSLGTRTLLGGVDLVIEDGEHVGRATNVIETAYPIIF